MFFLLLLLLLSSCLCEILKCKSHKVNFYTLISFLSLYLSISLTFFLIDSSLRFCLYFLLINYLICLLIYFLFCHFDLIRWRTNKRRRARCSSRKRRTITMGNCCKRRWWTRQQRSQIRAQRLSERAWRALRCSCLHNNNNNINTNYSLMRLAKQTHNTKTTVQIKATNTRRIWTVRPQARKKNRSSREISRWTTRVSCYLLILSCPNIKTKVGELFDFIYSCFYFIRIYYLLMI